MSTINVDDGKIVNFIAWMNYKFPKNAEKKIIESALQVFKENEERAQQENKTQKLAGIITVLAFSPLLLTQLLEKSRIPAGDVVIFMTAILVSGAFLAVLERCVSLYSHCSIVSKDYPLSQQPALLSPKSLNETCFDRSFFDSSVDSQPYFIDKIVNEEKFSHYKKDNSLMFKLAKKTFLIEPGTNEKVYQTHLIAALYKFYNNKTFMLDIAKNYDSNTLKFINL